MQPHERFRAGPNEKEIKFNIKPEDRPDLSLPNDIEVNIVVSKDASSEEVLNTIGKSFQLMNFVYRSRFLRRSILGFDSPSQNDLPDDSSQEGK